MDHSRFVVDGIKLIPPQTIVEGLPNGCMYYIAHEYSLRSVNYNFLCLGSGATMALGESLRAIRRREADVMLAGGYDSWVNWVYLAQLSNQRLLSRRNDDPLRAQRPFSRDRDGSVAGEGAGLMVLERLGAARARGAEIIGEVRGYAAATGAPQGDEAVCIRSLADCIRRALSDAECTAADLDFIHLTGDATPAGDRIESHAVRAVLGDLAATVPVTTLKSATGHLGNASGAVELAAMLESMRRGVLLPIVNLIDPDPELQLDFVTSIREGLSLKTGLMLSRGWPSHFTALVVGASPSD
jgi:3-oxoacyl-[acyl-carrier-protein] synthase II